MAVGRLGPSAKCMWVESPEPSEGDSNDGEALGQTAVELSMTKIVMAQHATEIIMHPEPVKFGVAEEEMAQSHMNGNIMEGTVGVVVV